MAPALVHCQKCRTVGYMEVPEEYRNFSTPQELYTVEQWIIKNIKHDKKLQDAWRKICKNEPIHKPEEELVVLRPMEKE